MNPKLQFLDDQYRLRNSLYLNCVKELTKATDFQMVTITNNTSAGTLTAQNNFIIALIEKLLTGYCNLENKLIKLAERFDKGLDVFDEDTIKHIEKLRQDLVKWDHDFANINLSVHNLAQRQEELNKLTKIIENWGKDFSTWDQLFKNIQNKVLDLENQIDKLNIKGTISSPLKPTTNNQRYKTQQGNSYRFTYGNSKKGQTTL